MDKKGEFSLQGNMIALIFIGLFFGFIGFMLTSLGGNYDASGYDYTDLENYSNILANENSLKADIEENYNEVDKVNSDPNWFDFFSGIFSKILTPFKFTYRSFQTSRALAEQGSNILDLPPVFYGFIATLLTILVLSVVLYRYLMGRK